MVKLQKLNTAQIIALGFAGVIFVGGILLWLPFCTVPGETTSFTDAMFTATTCVCVTGLVTVTTAAHWTLIGKIVILLLIQIGGIGIIALASLIFIYLHRKISLRNRRMIQESYNLDQMEGLVKLVKRVILSVLGAEAIGAVLYAFRFVPEFGPVKGVWYSVFTAVSAFCNAGIDLFGENSLADYVGDPAVNLITVGLIVAAGLGFTVWWDLGRNIRRVAKKEIPIRRFYKNLRLHSKIVIDMTLLLVIGGAVLIFLFEYRNPDTMKDLPVGTKALASLFQSVTTRTAGFFTIDQGSLSTATVVLCLFLMFVGGSPMGTAGGIKTTTLAILILSMVASVKGNRDVEIHNRKVRDGYIRSAVVVTVIGFMVLLTMCLLLAVVVPWASLADILYELTSAIATVGLTRGLTPELPVLGKWIVILTMYLGRIGPITLGTAVFIRHQRRSDKVSLAEGDIMIG